MCDVFLGNDVRLRLRIWRPRQFCAASFQGGKKKGRRIFEFIRCFLRTYGIRVSCNNILEPKLCLLLACAPSIHDYEYTKFSPKALY